MKATTSPAPMTLLPCFLERRTETWRPITSAAGEYARGLTRVGHHVCMGYAYFWSFFPPTGMPTWIHEQAPGCLWALARDQNDLAKKVQQ